MTDAEVMRELRADTALNRARAVFSSECARIEQECAQRRPPSPIEMRRMEFEAIQRIAKALGVTLSGGAHREMDAEAGMNQDSGQ